MKKMHRIPLMIQLLCICADCFVFPQKLPSSQITSRHLLVDEPYVWPLAITIPPSASADTAKAAFQKGRTKAILNLLRYEWLLLLTQMERDCSDQVECSSRENQEFLKRRFKIGASASQRAHRLHGGGATGEVFPSSQLTLWIRKATPRVG
ncbi:hypothetical protein RvY_14909-1 [Ramazzottius varieornatus]|uniref:Uncharacterized protein n=1 Tax=Ramazzottius varieornatus TaxID=947166 RepID=A0A1D1W041_RAMVA|nr:hypothetical protein RvY_14909-1 [Ramazzottius varieornatus]